MFVKHTLAAKFRNEVNAVVSFAVEQALRHFGVRFKEADMLIPNVFIAAVKIVFRGGVSIAHRDSSIHVSTNSHFDLIKVVHIYLPFFDIVVIDHVDTLRVL